MRNTLEKFTLIVGKEALPAELDRFNAFAPHNSDLMVALAEMTANSSKKVAVRHLDATSRNEPWNREEFLSPWQQKSTGTDLGGDPFNHSENLVDISASYTNAVASSMNSDEAYSRLSWLKESFISHPTFPEVQADMMRLLADESLVGCIVPWVSIHDDPLYYTVITSVAMLLTKLAVSQLQFLVDYTRWDEPGVLFIMLKYVARKVSSYLARLPTALYPPGAFYQFMLGFYKPGAFCKFMDHVAVAARNMIYASFDSLPRLQNMLHGMWQGEAGSVRVGDPREALAAQRAAARARDG